MGYWSQEMPMQQLRAADGIGARALEFAILTAARSGEVRGATWSEIDLSAKIWTTPAARIKGESRAPRALVAGGAGPFDEIPRIAGNDLVFPAPRGRPLSDMTLSAVLRRIQGAGRTARLPLHVSGLGRRADRLPSGRRRNGSWPQLTKVPSGTHKRTEQEREAVGKPAHRCFRTRSHSDRVYRTGNRFIFAPSERRR